MIVKCMLPISLVEKEGFMEYVEYLNPSFSMPTRNRIRDTELPGFKTLAKAQLYLAIRKRRKTVKFQPAKAKSFS